MKKITIIAVAALAVSFASCSKAKTCTCTTPFSGGTSTQVTTMDKVSSGDANASCPKTIVNTNGSNSTTTTCVLS